MMYIRLKFTKGSEVKYISHLDLMRVFQRALRRTGIPISYSSGFNPHMEISFGAHYPWCHQQCRYCGFKACGANGCQDTRRLNDSLPDGIRYWTVLR